MEKFEEYQFPSDKKLSNYPIINIMGDINRYANWLCENPTIDARIPPIYQNFIINFVLYGKNNEIFVHYNNELTAFCFRMRFDNQKILFGTVDYEEITDVRQINVQGNATSKAYEIYTKKWLENTALATAITIISVQAYILYFKPEIIEQEYIVPESFEPKNVESISKKPKTKAIKFNAQKHKRIIINPQDIPPEDDKKIKYQKLSWGVRGHYRRVGKDKKLKYIQPYICNRGGKKHKVRNQKYTLPDKKAKK